MHDATSTHTSLVAHARKSWSPAVAPCLAWASQFPAHGRPQGPQPSPTPLPPLRETRRLTIFSFLFHLRLMPIIADLSARAERTTKSSQTYQYSKLFWMTCR